MSCVIQTNIVNFTKKMKDLNANVTNDEFVQIEKLATQMDKKFLEKRHVIKYVDWCLKALKEQNLQKAKRHAEKIARNSAPFANDYPFNVGDDAFVQRYEHGFMECSMKVKITKRSQNAQGVWSYVGLVYKEDQKTFESFSIEIGHTRDLVQA